MSAPSPFTEESRVQSMLMAVNSPYSLLILALRLLAVESKQQSGTIQ